MSVLKSKNSEVEVFQFGKINPSGADVVSGVQDFAFEALDKSKDFTAGISEAKIREEREFEANTGFAISPIVKKHRGLIKQAESDYEKRVAEEVARRLEEVQKQAYQEGFDKGAEDGRAEALSQASEQVAEKVDELSQMIDSLHDSTREIFEKNKNDAYLMVKNLTKWIILKEVDNPTYLSRLLEKLICEINSKHSLTVRVNESSFGHMAEAVKIIERKLGKLTNVRVEIDQDQDYPGIKLESENTIIDGSLNTQFEAIDKLFMNAGVNES